MWIIGNIKYETVSKEQHKKAKNNIKYKCNCTVCRKYFLRLIYLTSTLVEVFEIDRKIATYQKEFCLRQPEIFSA